MENSGNSVQPQGNFVTNKVFLVRHSNVCVKQLLTGYTGSLGSQGVATLPSKYHIAVILLELMWNDP